MRASAVMTALSWLVCLVVPNVVLDSVLVSGRWREVASTAASPTPPFNSNNGRQAMATRTTHRSRTGTKLYAVRNKTGQFEDIQTYKRAHGQDLKRSSRAESATSKKKTAKKSAKKAVKKSVKTRKSAKKK
jgi:hypothetical protein